MDAYGAQHARVSRSTIGAAFALAGLYLAVERGFNGFQVQQRHIKMARSPRPWPRFEPPPDLGPLTVADVVAAEPGAARDSKLMDWCTGVWRAWSAAHDQVREMVARTDDLGMGRTS